MSVTIMHRDVPYTGLVAPSKHGEAVRCAVRIASRTGRRMRVHRVPGLPLWGGHGWHICEVGYCRKDQA